MKHVGRGKYMPVVEGTLVPPPPKRVGPFNHRPRKASGEVRKHFAEGTGYANIPGDFPGWAAWRGRTRSLEMRFMPPGSYGRPAGLPDGMTKAEMERHLKEVQEFMNNDDLTQSILKQLETENPIVQVTMRFHLDVLLGNYGIREKQNAARELNLYYKSKPLADKPEAPLGKEEEDWNTDLEGFADEVTAESSNCSPKLN